MWPALTADNLTLWLAPCQLFVTLIGTHMNSHTLNQMPTTQKAWDRLNNGAAQVIALRLALLPWQWMFDPAGAKRETEKMFSEKKEALAETQIAWAMLPVTVWIDLLQAGKWMTPQQAMARMTTAATRDVFQPAQSRVTSNLKRLGHKR